MKNKRIWLVIVCILVVGVLVTRYTSSVVNREEPSQEMAAGDGAEMRMAEVEAEAAPAAGAGAMPETTAGSPSPAVKEKRSVQDAPTTQVEESGMTGVQEDEAFAEAAPAMAAETPAAGTAGGPGARAAADPAAAAASGSAGPGATAATGAAPDSGAASGAPGASSGTGASSDAGNGPGAGPGAASTTASMPASPLEGVGGRAENTTLVPDTDYRQRLVDLDNQIQKLREEDKDSSAYSLKASAELELKLWEGEMNTVYNALLDKLNEEDAASLAAEQQEWMKSREARAVENNAKNNAGSLEGVGVTTSLTALTRDRAYELVERYEELIYSK